jgi:rubrerythrin
MAKKKIKARELLSDVRAGLDDEALMQKYSLSARGVLQALNKLIAHGLMSPEEFIERRSLAKTVYMPVFTCSACGNTQFSKVEKCPRCGARLRASGEGKSDFSY